jgi:NADH-quinone oxidoreductase subunit E
MSDKVMTCCTTDTLTENESRLQGVAIEERLNDILSLYQGKEEELIPILQYVQQEYGYLPELAMQKIARFLHMPESDVFGVATFYAQFKLVPTGKKIIKVCRGTACHVRGGAKILKEVQKQLGIGPGETTPDLEYSLETVACFGACALAPVMVENEKVHGRMAVQKVKTIVNTETDSGDPEK